MPDSSQRRHGEVRPLAVLVDDVRGVLVPLMAGRRRRAPRRAGRPIADLLLLSKKGGQGRSLAAAAGRVVR